MSIADARRQLGSQSRATSAGRRRTATRPFQVRGLAHIIREAVAESGLEGTKGADIQRVRHQQLAQAIERLMVRDDGGLILPMFNQFIDATGAKVDGWVDDPHQELMNGYALAKCWLQA